jgi:hypothetical protein
MRPQTRTLHARLHDEREIQDNGRGSVRTGHRGVDRRAGNCISIGAMKKSGRQRSLLTVQRIDAAGCCAILRSPSTVCRCGAFSRPSGRVRNTFSTILDYSVSMGTRPDDSKKAVRTRQRRQTLLAAWLDVLDQLDGPGRQRPEFRPDPPSQHQDSPVRREPGGVWPPTPGRSMWPPLAPGFGGRRLSRFARVR